VASEDELPYMRSPLSKELWAVGNEPDKLNYLGIDGQLETYGST